MLERILPKQFDNNYQGHWLGLGLFGVVIAFKALQSITSLAMPANTMVSADGIPLASFDHLAAGYSIYMFALLGMYLLLLPLQGVVALVRYRSMVPILLVWLFAVQVGARLIRAAYPPAMAAATNGHAIGFYINMGLLALTVIAFVLSIFRRGRVAS